VLLYCQYKNEKNKGRTEMVKSNGSMEKNTNFSNLLTLHIPLELPTLLGLKSSIPHTQYKLQTELIERILLSLSQIRNHPSPAD
jgi:hypothetical protein